METKIDNSELELESINLSNEKQIENEIQVCENLNHLNLEIKRESQELQELQEPQEIQEAQEIESIEKEADIPIDDDKSSSSDEPINLLIENPIDTEIKDIGNLNINQEEIQDTKSTQPTEDKKIVNEIECEDNIKSTSDERNTSNRLTKISEKSIESSRKIIVVFGSGGSGKTSLINVLCNVNEQLNDGAGCNVMEAKSYDFENVFGKYTFFDTMGLNTVDTNGDEERTASFKLSKLLKEKNREISLFIFVFKGIINKEQKRDYDNFYAKKNSKIPILCVVNGLESEINKQEWVDKNKHHFERNNLIFHDIVGTSFIKHEFEDHDINFKTMRQESGNTVWNSITQILNNFEKVTTLTTTAITTPIKKKSSCTIL